MLRDALSAAAAWVSHRLDPLQAPVVWGAQPVSLGRVLPYEGVLTEGTDRPVVVLEGGALGLVWELPLLEHETVPHRRDQGNSERLMDGLVADVASRHLRVRGLCWVATDYLRRHPDLDLDPR